MRIAVDHRTTYRFTAPQARITQLLRLTPAGTDGQTITDWRLHVDCDARMRHGRDGFGNRVTMLYVEGPLSDITIEVSGEALTAETNGVLSGSAEPLPPAVYRRPTAATMGNEAIEAMARGATVDAAGSLDGLHRLNRTIHQRYADGAVAGPVLAAKEAVGRDALPPRDRAQLMVAACHAIGVPARFVSGYHLIGERTGTCRPHGWVETYVDALGWVAFDPSLGISADAGYLRVAVGPDAAAAAPIAGSRLGEGAEMLAVDVAVTRVGGQ